ncbi:MAG: hypothetical protein R2697_08505 [Ilumatobacteraceae bacterium]
MPSSRAAYRLPRWATPTRRSPTPQPELPPDVCAAAGRRPRAFGVGSPRPHSTTGSRPPAGPREPQAGRRHASSRGKADLPLNDAPRIEIDLDTFAVRIDGELITESPAVNSRDGPARYFLF